MTMFARGGVSNPERRDQQRTRLRHGDSMRSGSSRQHDGRRRVLLGALFVLAAAARIAAARGDLWFDEIWSLSFARELDAPWEVLTRIHHDNNHPLNTLALYLTVKAAGAHARPIAYRLLSLLSGIAIIPCVCWLERRPADRVSHARRWFAAIASGLSFLALVYSSEARGYAPVALCAVVAFTIVRRDDVPFTRNRRLAFALACALGVLSHLTFAFVYAGLAAWTLVRARRADSMAWRDWIAVQMLPAACLIGDYLVDVRKLNYGGGPPFRTGEVVARTLSLAVNGPAAGALRNVAAGVTAALVLVGIADLYARKDDEWVFFTTAVLLAPLSILLLYRARYLDPRYFFVLMPFFWMLAARSLARLWTRGTAGRVAAATFAGLYVAGGVAHAAPFLRDQRGDYAAAVETVVQLSALSPITIGSDHDVRNRMVLDYYGEVLPRSCQLTYVPADAWDRRGPEWFVTHQFEDGGAASSPPASIAVNAVEYRRTRSFPYGGISGWTWHLYHTTNPDVNRTASAGNVCRSEIHPGR